MLSVNQVFRMGELRKRLLWSGTEQAVWIDIDLDTALPESISVAELERLIIEGELESIGDPFEETVLREVEAGSPDQLKRDEAWAMLADYMHDPQLFVRRPRGLIVGSIMQRHGVTKQTVYRLLRRYWQRGMCRNALLPDYVNSGARGKRRKPNRAKLGRPRVVMAGKGRNVTPDIERIFRRVIEERLLKEKHPSIPDAYASGLNLLRAVQPELPTSELPTLGQFRYFYGREYHFTDTLPRRMSAVDFAKDFRPLNSTSTTETLGPGYRYQIDATIADIYLVSEHDRSLIVGRPVVYMVLDVFSRMVVGMYVGFEGPSWVSAMVALANTVADKVEYCRQYGLEIDASDWPVKGLPDVILADKGELNGTKVEAFSQAFGVRIENAPARRGDAKGIVERYFRTVQERFKPYASGVVEDTTSRKRGGHDYRLDASLTLPEFTKIIIAGILHHNNFHTLSKYDRAAGMIELLSESLEGLSAAMIAELGRYRHQVFIEKLGWDVVSTSRVRDQEFDQFDHPQTRYIVAMGRQGICGCARLLPTTDAYLLKDVFAYLCSETPPSDPSVWELSRYAASAADDPQLAMKIFWSSLQCGWYLGASSVVAVTTTAMERYFVRNGVILQRLGPPQKVKGETLVAISFPAYQERGLEMLLRYHPEWLQGVPLSMAV